MDALSIGVVAFAVAFMIVGLVFAHYANKASEKMQQEELKKEKERQEEIRKPKNKKK